MSKEPRQTPVRYESSIVNGALYFEDARQCALDDELASEILDDKHLQSIRVVSLSSGWYYRDHLTPGVSVKNDVNVEMTLRKEMRSGVAYWYAYRRVFYKLHKRYVGGSEQVTEARLVEVARKLPSV